MVAATYFCYEKVRRTMCAAIVSNLFNEMNSQLHKEMKLWWLLIISPALAISMGQHNVARLAACWENQMFQNNEFIGYEVKYLLIEEI